MQSGSTNNNGRSRQDKEVELVPSVTLVSVDVSSTFPYELKTCTVSTKRFHSASASQIQTFVSSFRMSISNPIPINDTKHEWSRAFSCDQLRTSLNAVLRTIKNALQKFRHVFLTSRVGWPRQQHERFRLASSENSSKICMHGASARKFRIGKCAREVAKLHQPHSHPLLITYVITSASILRSLNEKLTTTSARTHGNYVRRSATVFKYIPNIYGVRGSHSLQCPAHALLR